MYGFKSFMDRTQILFDDGVTAVVGPNGCGKSNVADAIRWVLGEQSAKTLRGSVMQDIIFNGTESKKSLSFCEVSLFFDNADRAMPLEYDELCVTRKLYRSGESEYLINKTACRLKDIVDLMRKAQIGREGYSIIGQGRVEQMINLRPEERRDIFDEATGIAGAKQKKLESERKLGRTKDNIVRYLDILGEIERQVEPMRAQAVTAKAYIEFKEQLKHHELNNFIYRTDLAENEKAKLHSKVEELTEELQRKSARSVELENEYQALLEDISKSDEKIKTLNDKRVQLVVAREKLVGQNELNSQRIDFLKQQNQSFEKEIETTKNLIEKAKTGVETAKSLLNEKGESLDKCRSEIESIEERLTAKNKELQEKSREIDRARNESLEKERSLAEINKNIATKENSYAYTESMLADLTSDESSSDKKIVELIEKQKSKESEREEIFKEITSLNSVVQEKTAEISNIKDEIFVRTNKITDLDKAKAGMTSQRNFLAKMKESFEGFSTSVRKLLVDAKENRQLSSKIEGVVANLIKVPKELEIAIEATLGNAIQNVVTESVEDTKYLISYLKEKRYGIVTFLPIPFVKPRELTNENSKCLTYEGVLGVASDLVSFDEKYKRVMKSLLGATVIVDNMDNAIKVAKDFNSSFKIVTLDGSILSTGGSISGGSYKPQISNILSYDREILNLEADINRAESTIDLSNKERSTLEIRQKDIEKSIRENQEKIRGFEIKLASIDEIINSIKANSSDEKTQTERRFEKVNQIKENLSILAQEIERLVENRNNLESKNDSQFDIEEMVGEYEEIRGKAAEINDTMTKQKVEEVRFVSEIASLNSEIMGFNKIVTDGEDEINQKKNNIESNIYIIEKCKESFVDVKDTSKSELEEIESALKDVDKYKIDKNAKLKEVDGDRTSSITELQKLESKKNAIAYEFEKVDSDLEIMAEKLSEEYDLTYEAALKYKDEEYKLSTSNSTIKKLKEQIYNLGNVNVNAIEELLVLNERYETMTKQKDDLLNSEKDLNKIIEELNIEMRTRFDEGFVKVNEYFAETFKELFGGGNARLKLLEGDSSSTKLDYGVDIEAEPPGKSLQNINLLSGGEKALTAIAIIISIMKLRPMPFCIFDEIEAALDEVNAVRFSKYLEKFEDYTQFILITHKKSTMEMADRIFGVTMQEKGVSKVVSVNLKDKKEELLDVN